MILYWIIFLSVIIGAFKDCKRTIIIWMPMQLLFNNAVALKYSSPVLSLTVCLNLLLPIIFYWQRSRSLKLRQSTADDTFFYKPLFIAYIVSYALSLLFSIVPIDFGYINTMIKFFFSSFALVAVFQKCLTTINDIHLYLKVCFIVLVLLSLNGLCELVLHDNPALDYVYLNAPDKETIKDRMFYVPPFMGGEMQMRYGLVRAMSFFGIHIGYGCACILFFYMFMSISQKNIILNKRILQLSIIMSLLGVILCNSKTPLVGILFILLATLKIRDMINIRILLALVVILTACIIYVPSILDNIFSLFDSNLADEGGGSTVAGRQAQFEVVKRLFFMNPLFGNGVGSIAAMYNIGNNSDILGAESSWFQILPERGLLGCLVYIYWYFYSFNKMTRVFPVKEAFFFLAGLLVMETSTGILDMGLYSSIIIVLYKYKKFMKLNHITK